MNFCISSLGQIWRHPNQFSFVNISQILLYGSNIQQGGKTCFQLFLSSFALCGSPQRTVAPLQHRPPAAQRCQMMLLVHLIIHLSPQHLLRIRGLLHRSSLNVSLQVKAIFNSNNDAFIKGVLMIVQFAEYAGSATRKVPLRGKMQLSRIFLGEEENARAAFLAVTRQLNRWSCHSLF